MTPETLAVPRPLSVRRNFSWTFGSAVISGGCLWASLAVLAKLGTPEMVGRYALALAITAPIILFANLNLRQMQATDARQTHALGEYLGLRLAALGLALPVILAVGIGLKADRETACVLALVTAAKLADSISDVLYGLFQQSERMDYSSISRMLQGALQLVTLGIVMALTGSLVWAVGMVALASGLVTVFYDIRMAARLAGWAGLRPSWNGPRLWALARLAFPLGIVGLLGMLNINLPRFFVEHWAGVRELGIFSAMWSLLHPVGMVSGSVIQAVAPRMARAYLEDIGAYKRLLSKLTLLAAASGAAGVLLAIFAGRGLLSALFRPEYAERPAVFVCIMAAAGLFYVASALGGALNAARQFRAQPWVYGAALLVNIVCCSLLVPRAGIGGAAWAYFAGCATWLAGFALLVWRAVRARERPSDGGAS